MDVIAVHYITPNHITQKHKNRISACFTKVSTCLVLLLSVAFSQFAKAEIPIYAAYVSEQLQQQCNSSHCTLNPIDGNKLTQLAGQIAGAQLLAESLALSDYEVLIGNALINITENNSAELVLEITTSWRQVPIDDIEIKALINISDLEASVQSMLQEWSQHLEINKVLEADRIYQTLEASNYTLELNVPEHIGDFVLQASAVYRDPLFGSITRYVHPDFADAVVDISVYPFSPFAETSENIDTANMNNDVQTSHLEIEMNYELSQIHQLIAEAKIQDFSISDIQVAQVQVGTQTIKGLRIEVLLNTNSDPVYSTQYVFKQNDKIIKLTGNLPQYMMSALVNESLPKIKVPTESYFMRSLRQG